MGISEGEDKLVDKRKAPWRWLIISFIGIVICLGIGFSIWRYVLGHNGRFVTKTTPMSVGAEIESKGVSRIISNDGGELTVKDNETTIVASFPAKSFIGNESVSMRKINSIEGLPESMEFVAGTELTPDGISLTGIAEVKIVLPEGTDTSRLVGFAFDGKGSNFHFTPGRINGTTVILPISSFSSHGIINLADPDNYPPEPSAIEQQALQDLALGRSNTANQQFWGHEINEEAQRQTAIDIFKDWYYQDVRWKLIAATKDEAKVEDGIGAFIRWLKWAQWYGFADELNKEVETGYNYSATAVRNAADASSKKCMDAKDALQTGRMITLAAYADLLPIDGRQGLNSNTIKEKANKCAQFELRISSTIDSRCGSCDSSDIGVYSGTVQLTTEDNFAISGEGIVNIDSYREMVGTPQEHGCTYNRPLLLFPVKVPTIQVKTTGNTPSVSLLLSIVDPGDYEADCSFWVVEETTMTVTGSVIGATWHYDFGALHEDEIVERTETTDTFYLPDWEIINKDGVFARKVYDRSKTSGYAGFTGTDKEHTIFELVHTPQR
ncbi:MAG: hypothetical protein BWY68_00735 [bacterium ADurb.Bin400]|nr:MAG: hypothetical protein BWY68_00735 [bacterium ADurb.Bin400]